jgi:hypothetical protein
MPKKYNWDFVEDFENEKALDLYLLTQVQTSTEHSNINNCSICTSEHIMNYKIRVCTSTECNTIKPCIFKFKILKCCRTGKIKLYSLTVCKYESEKGVNFQNFVVVKKSLLKILIN